VTAAPRRGARRLAPLAALLLLAGCELPDWLGEREPPALPGERLSVLSLEQTLEPDPRIADLDVRLPRPWLNDAWPQPGGYPSHAMYHLELGDRLGRAWQTDFGTGAGSETRLLAQPVTDGRSIFAMDSENRLSAIDTASGRMLWRISLVPEEEDSGAIGGGMALADGRLYVTTPYGFVNAIDPATGSNLWAQRVGVPFRSGPAAADGRVFAISYDNQLHALDGESGRVLWTHAGTPEDAGLLGSSSPAVFGSTAIGAFSSGELVALRVDNGRVLWQDQLVRPGRITPLGQLSDIRGLPVVDRDRVIAISHSGRMAAIDLVSGERIWDRDVAGVETPWVAGEFIYVVTVSAEMVCLSRRDGRIRWVRQLQAHVEADEPRSGPVTWSGPVLAGDRLIAVSSLGTAVSLSPYDGEVLGQLRLSQPTFVAPIVAAGTLYVVTDGAELLALR